MARLVTALAVLSLLLGACKGDPPRVPRRKRGKRRGDAGIVIAPRKLGADLDHTLDALTLGHARMRAALGAHKLTLHSKLDARLDDKQHKTVEQRVWLHVDSKGNFSARKQTHRQHGFEVRWVDGWLYVGRRYNRLIKRRPQQRDEPRRLGERVYGLLPAYIDLLEPFIDVKRGATRDHLGRRVVEVSLSLAKKPRPPGEPDRAPARKWRRKISVTKLTGSALLDANSGVPLSVDLSASWTFVPPKGGSRAYPSGIPADFGGGLGRMTLSFKQRVDQLGSSVAAVSAPADTRVARDIRRLRLEAERQIVAGERDMPKRWPNVYPNADSIDGKRKRQRRRARKRVKANGRDGKKPASKKKRSKAKKAKP